MSNLTIEQVKQFEKYKEDYIKIGRKIEQARCNYDLEGMTITEILFFEFGRFCQRYDLTSHIENYELYLLCGANKWDNCEWRLEKVEEHLLWAFLNRVTNGVYKSLLWNDDYVIIESDDILSILDSFLGNINTIEFNNNIFRIIKNNDHVETLVGYEEMSEGEIYLRKYVQEKDSIIVLDGFTSLLEATQNNLRDKEYFQYVYNNVLNIHSVIDNELPDEAIKIIYRDGNFIKSDMWIPE